MRPGEFLAVVRGAATAPQAEPDARTYRAVEVSAAAEYVLTLHTGNGQLSALAYTGLTQITGDETGGTRLRLRFGASTVVDIAGRNLAPVFQAIRTRRAAHLTELVPDRHSEPQDGQPVITAVKFGELGRTPGKEAAPARAEAAGAAKATAPVS